MSKLATVILGALVLLTAAMYLSWTHFLAPATKLSGSVSNRSLPPSVTPSASGGTLKEVATPNAKTSPPPVPDARVVALHAGETLDFVADVAKLTNVASLRIQILEQRNFLGKDAWHLQAVAHTENPLRMVFELDDQFDSYSEASSLSSLQYEMHLNERGQKIESIQRMTTNGPGPGSQTAETRVIAGTRDPLGFMQFLRTVDWSHIGETRGPVYDGHKLYEVRASYQGTASIAVPAGTFSASKIEIRVYESGIELKDAHFVLYLAEGPARTPVLLEAVLPFATARVALARMR